MIQSLRPLPPIPFVSPHSRYTNPSISLSILSFFSLQLLPSPMYPSLLI